MTSQVLRPLGLNLGRKKIYDMYVEDYLLNKFTSKWTKKYQLNSKGSLIRNEGWMFNSVLNQK